MVPLLAQCVDMPNTYEELFPYIVLEFISPIVLLQS